MNDATKNKGNIVIGEGVSAVGNFSVPGLALIEGSFHGDLSADELVVGVRGQLVGKVKARQAEVLGETKQELQVTSKLIVRSSGRVRGSAMYGELEVERGGSLQGSVKQIRAGETLASIRSPAVLPPVAPSEVPTLTPLDTTASVL
jgi:cytoskeletal protein CcmA (bactofilin family)